MRILLLLAATTIICGCDMITNLPTTSHGLSPSSLSTSAHQVNRRQFRTIFSQTKSNSKDSSYTNNKGNITNLDPVAPTTRYFYVPGDHWSNNPADRTPLTQIAFSCDQLDSSTSAITYGSGKKTALLNFANAHRIGGNPNKSNAQEETIMRSSNLYVALSSDKNLSSDGIYYLTNLQTSLDKKTDVLATKDVSFFRDSNNNYDYYDTPHKLTVLTAAGLDMRTGGYVNPENLRKNKWRAILKAAAQEKIECLILGALGGGVFAGSTNPKQEKELIAQAFEEIITDLSRHGMYGTTIKHIHFPIFTPNGANTETYDIFNAMIERIKVKFKTRSIRLAQQTLSRYSHARSLPSSIFSNTYGIAQLNITPQESFLNDQNFETDIVTGCFRGGSLTGQIYNMFTHFSFSQEKSMIEGENASFFKGTIGLKKILDESTQLLIGAVFDKRSTSFYDTSLSRLGVTSAIYHALDSETHLQLGIEILQASPTGETHEAIGIWAQSESQLDEHTHLTVKSNIHSLESTLIEMKIEIKI